MNDLGSGTSSASSKLIHGGLRYLEHGAFRLVREALNEREVLLRMAPHLVRPMRFMLPPIPGLRSSLLLRLGLILYDVLGARKLLPASRTVDLTHHKVGQPLKRTFRYGFEYSDWSMIHVSSCSMRSMPRSVAPSFEPARAVRGWSGGMNGNWC
jgi:glycerol-3-phosphate dehydrogenase